MSKYHATKFADENGEIFDSKKEYRRFCELKMLERGGAIENLRRQIKFDLLPKQVDEYGKCRERAVTYIADFVYYDKEKKLTVVEDVKGMPTDVYKIKRKLMLYFHGIEIQEI